MLHSICEEIVEVIENEIDEDCFNPSHIVIVVQLLNDLEYDGDDFDELVERLDEIIDPETLADTSIDFVDYFIDFI